jgi:hypothetical protein
MENLLKLFKEFVESGEKLNEVWDERNIMYYLDEDEIPLPYRFDEWILNMKECYMKLKERCEK